LTRREVESVHDFTEVLGRPLTEFLKEFGADLSFEMLVKGAMLE
jgi:hypothetical protein